MGQESSTSADLAHSSPGVWEKYVMALDEVTDRMQRISRALNAAKVDYALVGGQAVALWVATKDPAAVRTTKDVDILLRREDLPRARAAAATAALDYFEVVGVGMFLERSDPNPRKAVHLIWAGEKVRPEYPLPSPTVDERHTIEQDMPVVSLAGLVLMKLMSHRDQDRVHLRDLIDVGLVDRRFLVSLPHELASRLDALLSEVGQ
jgi:Nucleotidyl transferase AbiEii toxin, Type IV TA system